MVNLLVSATRLVGAFVLVALNGFFVAAEFAFVRVRPTAVEQYAGTGRFGSDTLQEVMTDLDDYLATTQLGITIASLGLGWIGEPAVAALIEPVLGSILGPETVHLAAFAIGFGFITFLHVVFGELAPKTLAIADAERIALLVAPPMKLCYYLLVPGIVVFNGAANAFTRALGVPPASESEEVLEEEELLRALGQSGDEGHVDRSEVEMIERVFDLDDTTVREVMVPRPDVVSVRSDWSLAELRETVLEAQHTRYPVLDADDPDSTVGFVDVKDVLWADEVRDTGTETGQTITAGDLAREAVVVPETTSLDALLRTVQAERTQMAIVVDEWGAFAGIATVEDVVERIVGDIRDGFDADVREPSMEERTDGSYVADGGVPVSTVNDTLSTDFVAEEIATIGGLVLDRLGGPPEVGDSVTVDGYRLAVDTVDGVRVTQVVLTPEPDSDSDADSGTDARADPDSDSDAGSAPDAADGDVTGRDGEDVTDHGGEDVTDHGGEE